MTAWNITRDDGRIVYGVQATTETAALLSVGWGYSAAKFEPNHDGRPAMIVDGAVYRAERKA